MYININNFKIPYFTYHIFYRKMIYTFFFLYIFFNSTIAFMAPDEIPIPYFMGPAETPTPYVEVVDAGVVSEGINSPFENHFNSYKKTYMIVGGLILGLCVVLFFYSGGGDGGTAIDSAVTSGTAIDSAVTSGTAIDSAVTSGTAIAGVVGATVATVDPTLMVDCSLANYMSFHFDLDLYTLAKIDTDLYNLVLKTFKEGNKALELTRSHFHAYMDLLRENPGAEEQLESLNDTYEQYSEKSCDASKVCQDVIERAKEVVKNASRHRDS